MLSIKALVLATGIWRAALIIPNNEIPFNMVVGEYNGKEILTIINDTDSIQVSDIRFENDSIFIGLPVFESQIKAVYSEKEITGVWIKYNDPNRTVPFKANHGIKERFITKANATIDVSGKWEVWFSKDTEDEYKASGIFKQESNKVTGTFLTETGDYRYLEGVVEGNQLKLSCFDGAHAFLFTGNLMAETLFGTYYSGAHWSEPWAAIRNETFELTDPFKLTYLKAGYDRLDFAFPDLDSNLVTSRNQRFNGKVVIVQVLGSWCPNCMDESRFYSSIYNEYHDKGLEIVGLAFEINSDFNKAKATVQKMIHDLDINYPILIAGKASKTEASEKLPMLNKVISFPTSIIINKKGEVVKIHTGFNGPATGAYFDKFKDEFIETLDLLLKQ